MTGFHTAVSGPLSIPLMQGVSRELMEPNTRDDIKRWLNISLSALFRVFKGLVVQCQRHQQQRHAHQHQSKAPQLFFAPFLPLRL